MKNIVTYVLLLIFSVAIQAQEEKHTDDLPYYEVSEYYETYTVGTISARMIDGLGFRYRWSTEDLNEKDLLFKPSEGARTVLETISHILGLSRIIVNTVTGEPTDFTIERPELSYEQMRLETLENLKKASDILKEVKDLETLKIKFISKNGVSEYPFWNLINGPIEDAVWHAGQLVSFRRTSGNPMNSKVSFLRGKIRD